MIKIASMLSFMMLFLSLSATIVFAIPTHDPPHPHNAATVHWELDGGPPGGWGSTAHNHRDADNFFPAPGSPIPSPQPYSAYAVWDCRAVRVDDDGLPDFEVGHGFINEWLYLGGGADHIPRYRFDAADPWPAAAQTAIRNAFSQWSSIGSDIPNHVVGLDFMEVGSGAAAEIEIHWHNITSLGDTNLVPGGLSTVTFDSDPGAPWFYGAAAATPSTSYHFLSTALHETGHVVGLDEQGGHEDDDDVMIWERGLGSKTNPADPGPGPAFDVIDGESIHGARDLYMIELSNPVGGVVILVDKFGLLAPYIGLASTTAIAAVATVVYVNVERRKEKQCA